MRSTHLYSSCLGNPSVSSKEYVCCSETPSSQNLESQVAYPSKCDTFLGSQAAGFWVDNLLWSAFRCLDDRFPARAFRHSFSAPLKWYQGQVLLAAKLPNSDVNIPVDFSVFFLLFFPRKGPQKFVRKNCHRISAEAFSWQDSTQKLCTEIGMECQRRLCIIWDFWGRT